MLVPILPLISLAACATLLLGGCAASAGPATSIAADSERNATIVLPEEIEITAINGAEPPRNLGALLRRGDREMTLPAGRADILAYYHAIWPVGDGHDTLVSDPVRFIADLHPGQRYRIEYVLPEDHEDARRLAADFKAKLQQLPDGPSIASSDSGLKFRRGLTGLDRTLVTAGAPIVVPAGTVAASAPDTAAAAAIADANGNAPAAGGQNWLGLMQAWWTQASTEERRAFLAWIAERP